MNRPITTADVCNAVAHAMRTPTCATALVYHPGETDPSGVSLEYGYSRVVFILLVSKPTTPSQLDSFDMTYVPLPFPED